jgi:hypothetical protein
LTDQEEGEEADPIGAQAKQNWIARCVQQVKAELQERSAKKKQESSQDRSSRRTATATVWIALLTFAVLFVGILQYSTFDRQLSEMKEASALMRGQLEIMQKTAEKEQRAILAVRQIFFDELPKADAPLTGKMMVVNNGRSDAEVGRNGVRNFEIVLSKEIPGPQDVSPNIVVDFSPCNDASNDRRIRMVAGDQLLWCFVQRSPLLDAAAIQFVKDGVYHLWASGIFLYEDSGGVVHVTTICRQYDSDRRRFPSSNDKECPESN